MYFKYLYVYMYAYKCRANGGPRRQRNSLVASHSARDHLMKVKFCELVRRATTFTTANKESANFMGSPFVYVCLHGYSRAFINVVAVGDETWDHSENAYFLRNDCHVSSKHCANVCDCQTHMPMIHIYFFFFRSLSLSLRVSSLAVMLFLWVFHAEIMWKKLRKINETNDRQRTPNDRCDRNAYILVCVMSVCHGTGDERTTWIFPSGHISFTCS